MPRQHSTRTGRTRGSWTPRLAGIGVVLAVAIALVAVYVTQSGDSGPAHRLPTRVVSVQTVGLVAQPTAGAATRALTGALGGTVRFGVVPRAEPAAGNPQWTADTMAGGTYVFIYVPDGKCLASRRRRHHRVLALSRCDLGPAQRWVRTGAPAQYGGHAYSQYRNLAAGQCLAAGGSGPAADLASLAPCAADAPAGQRLAFWWSA